MLPEQRAPDRTTEAVDRLDLAQALAGLTAKQRAVVVLRFLEDRPVAEVAEILGIAPGTVKRQSHDAMVHLRVQLDAGDEETPGVGEGRAGTDEIEETR